MHKAVLRFRTGAVGESIGIPFKAVKVYKGIWYEGMFHQPDIRLANWYSRKVTGNISDRSIWDISTSTRYIAPETFYEQLIERVGDRIIWGTKLTKDQFTNEGSTVVSTLPMDVVADWLEPEHGRAFKRKAIHVERWRIPHCSVHQTVYFPDPESPLYRATLTGDLLTAEYIASESLDLGFEHNMISDAFHLDDMQLIDKGDQRYGKIVDIDNDWRKQFIYKLTHEYDVYSLGRFSCWKNILLDDVLHDINVIKQLVGLNQYDRAKKASK